MKQSDLVLIKPILKQLLQHHNLTTNGLAKIVKLPTPTIHRLATGNVEDPRISTLVLIANYFHISIDQLIGRTPLQLSSRTKKTLCDNHHCRAKIHITINSYKTKEAKE